MLVQTEQQLVEACSLYSAAEQEKVREAIALAKVAHAGQVRKSSGIAYIIHPLSVALELERKYHDLALTVAAILHDAVEDCPEIQMKQIYTTFGKEVGFIVDAVTKTAEHFYGNDVHFASRIDKLLYGGLQDVRCLLLKIADRKDNLLTIETFQSHKQMRISFETQAVYFPLRMLVCYDKETSTTEESKERVCALIEQEGIQNHQDFENYLYKQSFHDLNKQIFEELYSCSENVVWEVSDLECFEELCKQQNFEDKARIISMESDGKNFKARFKLEEVLMLNSDVPAKFSAIRLSTS